jgi:uncharacterized protein (TIGR02453 family)
MSTSFPGFPPAMFTFLGDLARNNDRPWFEANKDRYRQDVVAPMSDFITAMAPHLRKISPHYRADPRPNGGSMFRIYRDVRFSRDKRPYKEHAACHFRHEAGRDAHAPGFYLHLAPGEVFFGGGIWLPPAPELKRIRDAISRDAGGWSRVVNNGKLKAAFGGVRGDSLTRPPKGFDADSPHIEDIKRKSFFAMRTVAPRDTLGDDFLEQVAATFAAASPLMRFICKAVEVPF